MNALVFPGQGSQKVGMARMMVQTFPWAAELAQQADRQLNRPLTQIMFEGPEETLKKTVNTVQLRAQAMEEAAPQGSGAMAAILMLDRQVVVEICREASALGPCVPANFNCPGQLVISGAAAAVTKAGELAKARGAKRVVALDVSGPFHSPLMEPARERLHRAMGQITFRDTEKLVFQNTDAAATQLAAVFPGKLLDQLTGTVRWEDQVQAMHREGIRTFIELGPGKVLSGMIKKILPDLRLLQAEDPETLSQLASQAHV